tara:strand:+ start:357 stop:581 length:225 start_codon:yes stop_codon:yes gene_type:complete
MATQIRFRRGTTSSHANFTGQEGEVTVDMDKDTLVVHDNVTVGGFPLMREDLTNLSSSTAIPKVNITEVDAGTY